MKLYYKYSHIHTVKWLYMFVCRVKEEYGDHYDPSDDTSLYYAWSASVLGPVLFLAATLHAVLWRWPSSAVGSIVSTHIPCNNVYF